MVQIGSFRMMRKKARNCKRTTAMKTHMMSCFGDKEKSLMMASMRSCY